MHTYFKRAAIGRKDMLPYIKATYNLCATVAEPIIARECSQELIQVAILLL